MHKLFVLYKLKLFTFLNFTLFISEKNIVNLKHNFGIEGSQVELLNKIQSFRIYNKFKVTKQRKWKRLNSEKQF